jgi:hypothetical protein
MYPSSSARTFYVAVGLASLRLGDPPSAAFTRGDKSSEARRSIDFGHPSLRRFQTQPEDIVGYSAPARYCSMSAKLYSHQVAWAALVIGSSASQNLRNLSFSKPRISTATTSTLRVLPVASLDGVCCDPFGKQQAKKKDEGAQCGDADEIPPCPADEADTALAASSPSRNSGHDSPPSKVFPKKRSRLLRVFPR